MSDEIHRASVERAPVEEIVHIQQEMARSWSLFVIGCINRLQSGNLETSSWLEAYGRYAADSAGQVSGAVQAFLRLRGGR